MSAELPALVRRWRVGRYTVELSIPRLNGGSLGAACVEWSPALPTRLSASDLRAYRRGRDVAVAELARELGSVIAVVEV